MIIPLRVSITDFAREYLPYASPEFAASVTRGVSAFIEELDNPDFHISDIPTAITPVISRFCAEKCRIPLEVICSLSRSDMAVDIRIMVPGEECHVNKLH